jgi:hypothetical protein
MMHTMRDGSAARYRKLRFGREMIARWDGFRSGVRRSGRVSIPGSVLQLSVAVASDQAVERDALGDRSHARDEWDENECD